MLEKKKINKKMVKKNSKYIPSGTFYFDPEEYLDKSLFFELKNKKE